MKIYVTKKDIKEGVTGSICLCPVALALKRRTKKVWMVYGHGVKEVGIFKPSQLLPPKACRFVDDFDNCFPVKPFSFELPS